MPPDASLVIPAFIAHACRAGVTCHCSVRQRISQRELLSYRSHFGLVFPLSTRRFFGGASLRRLRAEISLAYARVRCCCSFVATNEAAELNSSAVYTPLSFFFLSFFLAHARAFPAPFLPSSTGSSSLLTPAWQLLLCLGHISCGRNREREAWQLLLCLAHVSYWQE